MAENDDPTPGPAEQLAETSGTTETTVQPRVEKQRFTDRLWNFRAMVAVALAALLIGGGIGSAIAAVSQDDGPDRHLRFTRFGDGPGPMGPGGPNGFAPGQRRELRDDLKEMRKEFRQRMRDRMDDPDAPDLPTPPTPSPTKSG